MVDRVHTRTFDRMELCVQKQLLGQNHPHRLSYGRDLVDCEAKQVELNLSYHRQERADGDANNGPEKRVLKKKKVLPLVWRASNC